LAVAERGVVTIAPFLSFTEVLLQNIKCKTGNKNLKNVEITGQQYVISDLLFSEGPRIRLYGHTSVLRLIVQPCGEDDQFISFFSITEHRWNETDRGKPTYSGKTSPCATLSTTNLT
jgi:hypothetical protein